MKYPQRLLWYLFLKCLPNPQYWLLCPNCPASVSSLGILPLRWRGWCNHTLSWYPLWHLCCSWAKEITWCYKDPVEAETIWVCKYDYMSFGGIWNPWNKIPFLRVLILWLTFFSLWMSIHVHAYACLCMIYMRDFCPHRGKTWVGVYFHEPVCPIHSISSHPNELKLH